MEEPAESKSFFQKDAPLAFGNKDVEWLSGLMNAMLLVFFISSTLIFAASVLITPRNLSLFNRNTAISGVTTVFFLCMYFLLKRGFPWQATTLSSFYLLLLATYVIYTGWGLHDMILALYPILFIVASLILSRRFFILLTLTTLALLITIGVGELQGILVYKTSFLTNRLDIALITIILGCSAVLIRFLTERLLNALTGAKKSAANYKEIFNATSGAIFIIDPVSYVVKDINRASELMFGLMPDNAFATSFKDITTGVPPYTVSDALQFLNRFKQNQTKQMEWQVKDLSGHVIWVEVTLAMIMLDGNNLILAVVRDISTRKNAEEEQLFLQNYLKNVIDSMPSVIVGIDAKQQVTRWNQKAETLTGLKESDVTGKDLETVLPLLKNDLDKVIQAIKNVEVLRIQHERNNDRTFGEYTDVTIFPLKGDTKEGAVIRIDDMTEIRKTQEVMIQSEKMISVGGLAAGMAHEINNPLGAMMQSAQNIQRRFSPELSKNFEIAAEYGLDLNLLQPYLEKRGINMFIDGIRDAGSRAAKIIANMLQFSRLSESNMSPTRINQLLDQTIELAYNDYDLKKRFDFKQVELLRSYNPDMPLVPCIETEIEQVILNLLKNASQAIFANHSGEKPCIEIHTDYNDHHVIIEVNDNGPGVPVEIEHRIFEPFFTTKPVGEGTGLGLSVSYMIITQNHQGSMTQHNRPGGGSRFIITLPLQPASA
ncbi:MAG: PAS domain S-box protein [Deltaproteobacteria bacterium]|nr:PAS domain S-box protein [Deltaproteobacteria bacterium]